jgi:hypothetical protein
MYKIINICSLIFMVSLFIFIESASAKKLDAPSNPKIDTIITKYFAHYDSSAQRPLNFAIFRSQKDFDWMANPELKHLFAPDFVWNINVFKTRDEYCKMIKLLRERNPNAILGRYNSATCAKLASKDSIVPVTFPLEKCKESWLLHQSTGERVPYLKREAGTNSYNEDGRYFLDMRKIEVRSAVIEEMISRALNDGLNATCYDNLYWDVVPNNFPVTIEEWNNAMLSFYKEAGSKARQNGLLCVVNIAVPGPKIPQAVHAIASHVDGMMFETSFHPWVIENGKLQDELDAYDWALHYGKMIFLIPRGQTLNAENFALQKIRPLDKIRYGRFFRYKCTF